MPESWLIVIGLASALGGAIASVAGFGIGSVLTPVFAIEIGTKLAVAAVAIPHAAATTVRCWRLRSYIDGRALVRFGAFSAMGGLAGSLLHSEAGNRALAGVLGILLVMTGTLQFSGKSEGFSFGPKGAWLAGAVSGLLGGLVGNQGGIRSAALLGFPLSRQAFVATATATGVIVDVVRVPVYLLSEMEALSRLWPSIGIATISVLLGTYFGERLLHRMPDDVFRRNISALLVILGAVMLYQSVP